MADGQDYDGKQILVLARSGKSPFKGAFDIEVLLQEVEKAMGDKITEVPHVHHGSNNYGFEIILSDGREVIARLCRGDLNMPGFDGVPLAKQVSEIKFEAAVYNLLRMIPETRSSQLLYHRLPVQHSARSHGLPQGIGGRSLMIFGKPPTYIHWRHSWELGSTRQKFSILDSAARTRASLFQFTPPFEFSSTWILPRMFEQKQSALGQPPSPTRQFWVDFVKHKIEATIQNIGDPIAWESDNEVVGPKAFAAKQRLLEVVPHIFPHCDDEQILYRLVLDHQDYGIHNMMFENDSRGDPSVAAIFDWETGYIIPAILSDPSMAVLPVDLVVNGDGKPEIARVPNDTTSHELDDYKAWSHMYFETLFREAPDYRKVIEKGRDARHLWFALRDWRGQDPEGYFESLGSWAESILKDSKS